MIKLSQEQLDAARKMKNGCILCGGVGSGKSRTALFYYVSKDCLGSVRMNNQGTFQKMKNPRDLYIITTARKRDSKDWEIEAADFLLINSEDSFFGVNITVDSWNNIKKYKKLHGAFFVFDEQRVVGSGVWVKSFLDIARKNHWILLSATPGDQWSDYIPVFVANGFYRNRTEFLALHAVYARNMKYPKIDRYIDTDILERYRSSILVNIDYEKQTERHHIDIITEYDREQYRKIYIDRWDPFENCPIQEGGKFVYLLRKLVNSDNDRVKKAVEICKECSRAIIFYNFDYELEMLLLVFENTDFLVGQWNGHRHEECPEGEKWVYLVQYSAGCEAWNCITTNTILFFSQTYSYKILEQACGRIDRRNTPYTDLFYYHLRSKSSIDIAIKRKLEDKKQFNEKAFYGKFGF